MTATLLLHGFTGSGSSWRRVIRAASGQFLCPDVFGHGDALHSIGSWEDEVQRLARLLSEPGHWVGYSMGARLALAAAHLVPHKVSRLTLIGGHPGLEGAEKLQRKQEDDAHAATLERDQLNSFVAGWEALPMWSSQARLPSHVLDEQRMIRLSHRGAGLASCLSILGMGSMPSLWPTLRHISVPVDLVHGDEDRKYATIAATMAQHMAHARVIEVANCGHNPVLEAPNAIAEVIQTKAGAVS